MLSVLHKELGYKVENLKYKKVVGDGRRGLIDRGSLITFFPWKRGGGGRLLEGTSGRGLFDIGFTVLFNFHPAPVAWEREPPVAQLLERPD